MRKIRGCFLVLALILFVFALTACHAPTVVSAAVNERGELVLTYDDGSTEIVEGYKALADAEVDENGHLILTYTDGTVEDKGYQTIPSFTVTFVDHDGTVLSAIKTYRGLGVEAPASPEREDYTFVGWDKSFDSIMEDTTVTATYTPLPTYIVSFLDYDGTVLKTETVVLGKSATPPSDPTRDGYSFTGWLGDYIEIAQNTEVRAEYVEKGTCTVTFLDYNGLTLGTAKVKEGGTVTAPVAPTREGYTFKGWSSSLSGIMTNKTVTAQYTLVKADNVFDLAYKVSGQTVTVTLSLAGDVCLAGFEGTLSFEGMTATTVTGNSANVLANLKSDGTVSIAYTSATNVTRGETVLTVVLTKTQNASTGQASLALTDCFDQNFDIVAYKIIGENMKLEGEAQK
ncbi:MAG: InlB B-repeat-containing protein [Clostridia bacterium]|nr:InlB B-repeat-containing protein [Clostridia bacterium]